MSVSSSESATRTMADLAAALDRRVDAALAGSDGPLETDEESVRRIVTAAARLYARYCETAGPIDPLRPDVSPTEAVELACGLLRSRDLNPFDLALWFSR